MQDKIYNEFCTSKKESKNQAKKLYTGHVSNDRNKFFVLETKINNIVKKGFFSSF